MAKSNGRVLSPLQNLFHARELADQGVPPCDDAFREAYPVIFALLTDTQVSEDLRFDPCRLEVMNSAGDWCFRLSSPAARGHCEVLVRTFQEGLAALERALAMGAAAWHFWLRKPPATRPQKRKKEGGA